MSEMKDLIAIFKAEAEEHLTKLDNGIVELEKQPDNIDLAKGLNREVHTLKGAARVFGFSEIQDIAHRIEDIFEEIAHKKMLFNSSIAGGIFKGIDAIRIILEKIIQDKEIDVDVSDLCRDLETCLVAKQETIPRVESRPEKKHQGEKTQGEVLNLMNEGRSPPSPFQRDEYIRVPLSRVDKLLYLVGEMVIHRMKSSAKIAQAKKLSKLSKELQKGISSLSEAIGKEFSPQDGDVIKLLSQCDAQMQKLREHTLKLYDHVSTETFQLDPVIDELQTRVKEIKMLPLSTVFSGFPRMVRDIASQQGKEVNLVISGEETELDKKVLEGIKTSLIHLLRNCIDHGIEEPEVRAALGKPRVGTIKVSAFHEGDNVVITVEDDGRGMDLDQIKQTALKKGLVSSYDLDRMRDKEVLNIVFMNGYSTSPTVTDVSGRGMGLDIVWRDITQLKGRVSLDTQKNRATKFTLVLPLTIAIIQVLLVKVQNMLFALPMLSITECIKANGDDVSTIEGRMAIPFREQTVPLVRLNEVLGLPPPRDGDGTLKKAISVVIVSSLDRQVGFIVDEIVGDEEVFIKSLGKHLGRVKNVSGAIITPTGEVVVVLDIEDLITHSALCLQPVSGKRTVPQVKRKERRILVVEDTFSTRELEKSILETHGYLVDTAVDGLDALSRMTENKYDLIVSDIEMPRMDGFELCRTLKKNEGFKDIPFVMVTAFQKEEDKRKGMEVGAAAYIVKSAFEQTNLLDTIERLVG
jgi:chemotaxis protein histidine kinase CheA/CheY-like chemotaxis protein